MILLSSSEVTAADAAFANLSGWIVVVASLLVTVAWLLYLYR